MKGNFLKLLIFFLVLFISNLFLLKSGLWMHQDASYWYKTNEGALHAFYAQLLTFSNFDYYSGFDSGMLSFTKILTTGYSFLLFKLLGSSLSQITFILSGYILSFVSFYLFSTLFIKENGRRYVLSLAYAFNPLAFSLQGFSIILAGIPFYIYSIYKFYGKNDGYLKYLLLNIFSLFIIIVYIRFIEIAAIVIIPFLSFLFYRRTKIFLKKRSLLLLAVYVLAFLPSVFSFIAQRFENANTAFYYGELFKQSVSRVNMFDTFNLLQSFDLVLYDHVFYTICGIFFFVFITLLIIKQNAIKKSALLTFLVALLLVGFSLYGLFNIGGSGLYHALLKFFPFVTNAPSWSLYICVIPLLLIVGLTLQNRKTLYVTVFVYLIIAIFPLLNFGDMKLQKFDMSRLPAPYKSYFLNKFNGFPEATAYVPGICWRAEYMDVASIPTQCINSGVLYRPISYDNPRFISGEGFGLSEKISTANNLDNLRITSNLKNIIVARDIVVKKGPGGPLTGVKDLQKIKETNISFENNQLLNKISNENFIHYSYKDKKDYDFLLYSPQTVINSTNDFFSNSVDIEKRPVFVSKRLEVGQSVNVSYKISPLNSTRVLIKIKLTNEKPFALQFNQTFNNNWKLRWISQSEYKKEKCKSEESYKTTNNSRCQVNVSPLNLSDIKYLSYPAVSVTNHYIANMLNNMWYINPEQIQGKIEKSTEIYGVITYDKQIYFSWMILISLITVSVVVILVVVQEVTLKIRKYRL